MLIPRKTKYINNELCTRCGGKCCKRLPGITLPEDWGKESAIIQKQLIKAFKSKKYAIDWWEDDKPLYFVRPATKGINKLYDPSWGGECIFLTPSGCELKPEKRPSGCINLEPQIDGNGCINHGPDKFVFAKAWKPYKNIIHIAAKSANATPVST